MRPSRQIVRQYRIPRAVVRKVYGCNPRHRANTLEAIRKARDLYSELGLATPGARRLWQLLGLWDGAAA